MSYYLNSYSAGDTFIDYSGNKYTVVTGGNTPSTPFDSSNIVNDKIIWGSIELESVEEGGTGQGLVDYAPNTSYSVGDIVIYDDKIYRCITAHTSTSTFDDTKWQKIGDEVFTGATSSSSGEEGIVPQPTTSDISKFLCSDGTWKSAGGSGVSIGKELIWSGTYNTANNSETSFPNTLELPKSIADYDRLEITITGGTSTGGEQYTINLIDVDNIQYGKYAARLQSVATGSIYGTMGIVFTDATHLAICWLDQGTWSGCAIKKIVGIKYIQPDSYSTEEKLIGTWIDGKPLYRKVFSNPTFPLNTGLDGASYNVLQLYAHVKDSTNNYNIPYADTGYTVGLYMNNSSGVVTLSGSVQVIYVVVEYTKI